MKYADTIIAFFFFFFANFFIKTLSLFFSFMSLDDFENFREKNGDSCDDDEEEYFPVCREKNS